MLSNCNNALMILWKYFEGILTQIGRSMSSGLCQVPLNIVDPQATFVNLFQRLHASGGIQSASSHSGLRQFVTKLADQGINARLVQTLARHKHLSTTKRYIDVNENALRKALGVVNS